MTRFGIVGAGAIGSYLGAQLRSSGSDVVLLARDPHASVIEERGLTVEDSDGAVATVIQDLTVARSPGSLRECDYVLVCVKSQDTRSAIAEIASELKESAAVVSVQNGVSNWRTLADLVGDHRVIAAVALLGVEFLKPGVVRLAMPGRLVIGAPATAPAGTVAECQELLQMAIPTVATDEIIESLWTKLIINLDMAVLALTQEPYPMGLLDDQLRSLCLKTLQEGLGVLAAAHIEISNNPIYPALVAKIDLLESSGPALRKKVEASAQFRASTLQSLLRGRTTETDFLNGEIVRLGQSTGTHASLNAALSNLIVQAGSKQHRYAAGELANAVTKR